MITDKIKMRADADLAQQCRRLIDAEEAGGKEAAAASGRSV